MNRITLLFALLFSWAMMAQTTSADTTFIYTPQVELDWYGDFDSTVQFPDDDQSFRQIIMTLKMGQYNCPSSDTYCHQWDYNTHIQLLDGDDKYELGRFITPFATSGWPRFGSNWEQPYVFDVTDFYPLLKGEKEIRIFYSGYSGGFTAEIEFAFIEGTPEREVLDIKNVYHLSRTYGNADDPFNDYLGVFSDTAPEGTEDALLKVLVTGHGSDATEQCCEFSSHYYDVFLNDEEIDSFDIWRDNCGENDLYPQGGTWIYDRSNWCPGAKVEPVYHHLNLVPEEEFDLQVQFEEYTGSGELGSYNYSATLFYYGETNNELDAAVVDIVSPTNDPNHYRANPGSSKPVIKVRNAGSTDITTMDIQYGVAGYGQTTHSWSGNLAPQTEVEITLTAIEELTDISLDAVSGPHSFEVEIMSVNGEEDADATNNYMSSTFDVAPTWPSQIIMDLKTGSKVENGYLYNSGNSDISWKITDMDDNVIAEKNDAKVRTQYKDTVSFPHTGFYKMKIKNYNCFGLHWWPYDGAGSYQAGYFKVTRVNGTPIQMKNYSYTGTPHDDWGCYYSIHFTAEMHVQGVEDFQKPQFSVYPNPAADVVNVQVTGNWVPPYEVKLVDLQGRTVYQETISDEQMQISVGHLSEGMYMMMFKDRNDTKYVEKIIVGK